LALSLRCCEFKWKAAWVWSRTEPSRCINQRLWSRWESNCRNEMLEKKTEE
jgi:hypothetical protein